MLMNTPTQQLSTLLEATIADIDIPVPVRVLAEQRYRAVGDWLDRYWGPSEAGGHIYPQGSFALGTVVRPISGAAEYDIDLVCRRDLTKMSVGKEELKHDVGGALRAYVRAGADGDPTLEEGKRCWTFVYRGEPFHMDILPAIPNEDAKPNGIWITDRTFRLWIPSNPRDYAEWFRGQMALELSEARGRVALAKRMEVDDVPEWEVATTLQRSVQALKRHRDIHFIDREDVKPASIIITTLAARAYSGAGDLADVITHIVGEMPNLIERRAGVWWVPNPVQPDENFADRWQSEEGRKEAFFEWLELVGRDVGSLTEQRGLDRVISKMASMFGEDPAHQTAKWFGSDLAETRKAGVLGMAAGSGMLEKVAAKRPPVRDHTFHGATKSRHS